MPQSIVYRFAGNTVALNVSTAASSAISVPTIPGVNEQAPWAAFLNTGTTIAAVSLGAGGATGGPPSGAPAAPAVFPTNATTTSAPVFVLPPLMTQPLVVAVPYTTQCGCFTFSAITNSSVSPTIFVTPVAST